jgi:hypothetical protein
MIGEPPWEVEFTDQFERWWAELTEDQQDALAERVSLVATIGPTLGRPAVDHIKTSRHPNMKELRTASDGHLRVLFAFDPKRHAILLIGGNKSGSWRSWYLHAVPLADDLYDAHLNEISYDD